MPYTETFQRRMIARLSGRNAVSANALARETGVPQSTLSRWLRSAGTVKGMTTPHANDRSSSDPTSLSAADKQRLLAEADGQLEGFFGVNISRKALSEAGIDAIEVSAGTPASGMKNPARVRINKPEKEAYNLDLAQEVKKVVSCPIIT